jgi:transposase InsO family protein
LVKETGGATERVITILSSHKAAPADVMASVTPPMNCHERPRIITDNGPQFIAKDFKEFIRIAGMTHVKSSPYYPQSNGKIEPAWRELPGTDGANHP